MIRIDTPEKLAGFALEPKIGNVYRTTKGDYYILFRQQPGGGWEALRFNGKGELTGHVGYAQHYFAERTPIGFCEAIPEIAFEIEWFV